jgi:hypothetical protein
MLGFVPQTPLASPPEAASHKIPRGVQVRKPAQLDKDEFWIGNSYFDEVGLRMTQQQAAFPT